MAIYTTLFLCEPEKLQSGFPTWRPPLAEPVRREIRNPFTGELSVIESDEPTWPEEMVEDGEVNPTVVAIEGSYEDYLESRLPPFLRDCPHWATKDLTNVELEPLISAVGISQAMPFALYSPPSRGAVILQFPKEFPSKLRESDPARVAESWAESMSDPNHTHSVSGEILSDGVSVADALEVVRPIVELVRNATGRETMYLLIEA